MAHKAFSPKEAMVFGLDTVKKNLLFFAGVEFVIFFAGYFPTLFEDLFRMIPGKGNFAFLHMVLQLISWVIQSGVTLGAISLMLRVVDGKKYHFNDLFSQFKFPLLLKYLGASLVFCLVVIAGILLFIIPGIYLAIRLSYYSYFILEKKAGPIEALKMSWGMTKGNVKNLLVYGLIAAGVSLLGLIALVVGLLVTQPVVALGSAYIYRKLAK